jgi:hypothetical protein
LEIQGRLGARKVAFIARVAKSRSHYHITVPKVVGEKLYGKQVQVIIEPID